MLTSGQSHPPSFQDYERGEPQLSDVRASTSRQASGNISALSRRNAMRVSRRNVIEGQRASEQSRSSRIRRANAMRPSSLALHAQAQRQSEEPASKRRRTERSAQTEVEQLPIRLIHCDGGRYDGPVSLGNFSPSCALSDDSSGM